MLSTMHSRYRASAHNSWYTLAMHGTPTGWLSLYHSLRLSHSNTARTHTQQQHMAWIDLYICAHDLRRITTTTTTNAATVGGRYTPAHAEILYQNEPSPQRNFFSVNFPNDFTLCFCFCFAIVNETDRLIARNVKRNRAVTTTIVLRHIETTGRKSRNIFLIQNSASANERTHRFFYMDWFGCRLR